VSLASSYPTGDWPKIGWIEVKRADGSKVNIRLIQRAHKPMLICGQKPRLALYAWETNEGPRNVSPALWPCRVCAGLSYASEGRALLIPPAFPELKPFWSFYESHVQSLGSRWFLLRQGQRWMLAFVQGHLRCLPNLLRLNGQDLAFPLPSRTPFIFESWWCYH